MKNFILKSLVVSVVFNFALFSLLVPQIQAAASPAGGKIDINKASSAELQTLPRIGEKVAQRIIDFRKEHGKFKRIEEIMKVKGIGEKVFKKIKDLITVEEKTAGK